MATGFDPAAQNPGFPDIRRISAGLVYPDCVFGFDSDFFLDYSYSIRIFFGIFVFDSDFFPIIRIQFGFLLGLFVFDSDFFPFIRIRFGF